MNTIDYKEQLANLRDALWNRTAALAMALRRSWRNWSALTLLAALGLFSAGWAEAANFPGVGSYTSIKLGLAGGSGGAWYWGKKDGLGHAIIYSTLANGGNDTFTIANSATAGYYTIHNDTENWCMQDQNMGYVFAVAGACPTADNTYQFRINDSTVTAGAVLLQSVRQGFAPPWEICVDGSGTGLWIRTSNSGCVGNPSAHYDWILSGFTPSPPDHYEIVTSASTTTINTSNITVQACANATCSSLVTSGSPTITLNTTLQSGTIGTLSSTALTLASGTITITMSDTLPGVTRIGVAVVGSPAATNTWQCYNGTTRNQTTSCDVTFTAPALDHYQISQADTSTVVADNTTTKTVTVKACGNTDGTCTRLATGTASVTVTTSLAGTNTATTIAPLALTSGSATFALKSSAVGTTTLATSTGTFRCSNDNGATTFAGGAVAQCQMGFTGLPVNHYAISQPNSNLVVADNSTTKAVTVTACSNAGTTCTPTTAVASVTLTSTLVGTSGDVSYAPLVLTNGTATVNIKSSAGGTTTLSLPNGSGGAGTNTCSDNGGANADTSTVSKCQIVFAAPVNHYEIIQPNASVIATGANQPVTVQACSSAIGVACVLTAASPSVTLNKTGAATGGGAITLSGGTWTGNITDGTAQTTTLSLAAGTYACGNDNGVTPAVASGSAGAKCQIVFGSSVDGFGAVEVGGTVGSRLYTKLAGVAFSFDVQATSAGVLAPAYSGTLKIELVDELTGTACSDRTQLLPINNAYAFASGSGGVHTLSTTYSYAAKSARIRITDSVLSITKCSSDTFTIRPTEFSLVRGGANPQVAGKVANAPTATGFTLTATARSGWVTGASTADVGGGYIGTPTGLDLTSIKNWLGGDPTAKITFSAGASLTSLGAGTGISAAGTYYFDDFGTLAVSATNQVVDQIFAGPSTSDATTSNDRFNGDCDSTVSPYSNTLNAGGKYGCYVQSNTLAAFTTNRFIPNSYTVSSGVTPACGAITYFGQPFAGGAVTLTALSAAGTTMTSLHGTSLVKGSPTYAPAYYLTAVDGTVPTPAVLSYGFSDLSPSSLPSASSPASTWTNGQYILLGTGFSVTRPATKIPPYNDVSPYTTNLFKIALTVDDHDSVRIATCTDNAANGGTISSGVTLGAVVSPTLSNCVPPSNAATRLGFRYGILKLDNAYGSELLPLYVKATALYWNGAIWQPNSQDSCTTIDPANIAVSGSTGSLSNASVTLHIPSSVTLSSVSGGSIPGGAWLKFNLTTTATLAGTVGSADIALNLGAVAPDTSCISTHVAAFGTPVSYTGAPKPWLRGNWCGDGTYVKDPSARITFGTAKSPYFFQREKY